MDISTASECRGSNLGVRTLLTVVFVIGFGGGYFYGSNAVVQANLRPQNVENELASDQVIQYGIAARYGTATDVCIHAGAVASAYLDAQDATAYNRWKLIEKENCAKAETKIAR